MHARDVVGKVGFVCVLQAAFAATACLLASSALPSSGLTDTSRLRADHNWASRSQSCQTYAWDGQRCSMKTDDQ
jgi:hypothetical protein